MPNAVNYRMQPKDDLSVRTDFTYDLMTESRKVLQEIVEQVPAVKELRNRATVNIRLRGSLSQIDIDIDVIPSVGADIDDAELKEVRSKIFKQLREGFGAEVGSVLQSAIKQARERM